MRVREAYPDDKRAPSEQTTTGVKNSNSIGQKRPEDHLNRSIPTGPLALSPIEEFSNPHHYARAETVVFKTSFSTTQKWHKEGYRSSTPDGNNENRSDVQTMPKTQSQKRNPKENLWKLVFLQ